MWSDRVASFMLRYFVVCVQAQIWHPVLNYQGDGLVPILIQMKPPTRLIEKVRNATFPSSDARAEELVRRLQAFSVRTQKPLIPLLDRLRAEHQASQFRSYFVSNTVAVEASQEAIAQIYDLNHVYKIGPNFVITPPRLRRNLVYPEFDAHANPSRAPVDYDSALKRIGIHQVNPRIVRKARKLKYGNMDSGIDYSHPCLVDNYVGYNGKSFNHSYAWFDASRDASPLCPQDTFGHGTQVLSLAVGKHSIGISPRSKWIACLSNKHRNNPTEFYLSCQQFLLAPTNLSGETPLPRLRPHVIGNSWGCIKEENCFSDPFKHSDNAIHAAGIFSVSAAGNLGHKGCGSVDYPPTENIHAFVVGALEANSSQRIHFSSIGPGHLRPNAIDVVVPAQHIIVASHNHQYGYSTGTSAAAAIVGGSALLVMAACPHLQREPDALAKVLRASATPLYSALGCGKDTPTSLPNNEFGYGMFNMTAAINLCRAHKK